MMPMSVNSFETEPTRYTLLAVAATFATESAQPKPFAQTTRWPSTSAIEMAGYGFLRPLAFDERRQLSSDRAVPGTGCN
jgi:hypothetical protein